MANYNSPVLTNAGAELLRNILANGLALSASYAVLSEDVTDDPKNAAAIQTSAQTLPYSLYTIGKTQLVASLQMTNAGVVTPYTLNTIGFYANDGQSGDVLFAVQTAVTPDLIPDEDTFPVSENFKTVFTLDTSTELTIRASFEGYLTREDFNELMEIMPVDGGTFFEEYVDMTTDGGIF